MAKGTRYTIKNEVTAESATSKKMGRNYQAGELQKQLKGMLDDNIDR